MLSGVHQEFEVSQTFTTNHDTQSSHRQIIIDLSGRKWRERSVSGAGNRVRIFDGEDLFTTEDEGDEYIRIKRKAKDNDPEPAPYGAVELDWSKAKEIGRQPCGYSKDDHICIIFDAPVKGWARIRQGTTHITRMTGGNSRIAIDGENGLVTQSYTEETIDDQRGGYRMSRAFVLKGTRYGKSADASLFKLSEGSVKEVNEFTKWNASRIRKQLSGKPAPELQVTDIRGNPVSLAALKGKTVLLDFWTTWCPPCLADAPVLDDLYRRYADKGLMIVGISVNEDRDTVENFLQKHAHKFPMVLTAENEMPRAYQVAVFPTYIVVDPNGTVSTAFEGDQGFGELRKHLAQAGMEIH
jgi:thiol-disulfide isomerase/thioredoxin